MGLFCYNFSYVCSSLAFEKKNSNYFLLGQHCYQPALKKKENLLCYISGCLKAFFLWLERSSFKNFSVVFVLIHELFQFTHSHNQITLLRQEALADQSLHTYILSDLCRDRLSVWCWILSLTQTAAPLQSFVVWLFFFFLQFKVFLQLSPCSFCVFTQRK